MVRKEVANSVLNGRKPTPLLICKIENKIKTETITTEATQWYAKRRKRAVPAEHRTNLSPPSIKISQSTMNERNNQNNSQRTDQRGATNRVIRIISSLENVI
jgi:hypothetical protein